MPACCCRAMPPATAKGPQPCWMRGWPSPANWAWRRWWSASSRGASPRQRAQGEPTPAAATHAPAPRHVFISHSTRDVAVAEAVVKALEAQGIRCWIAPRDIAPGADYAGSLVEAIGASAALVLLLSAHSNASPQVLREVERAVSKGVPLIPLRLDDVTLSKGMEYFVSTCQWLDARTPPLEGHLARLIETVQEHAGALGRRQVVRHLASVEASAAEPWYSGRPITKNRWSPQWAGFVVRPFDGPGRLAWPWGHGACNPH